MSRRPTSHYRRQSFWPLHWGGRPTCASAGSFRVEVHYLSHNLHPLNGLYIVREHIGDSIGIIEGHTRSLEYGAFSTGGSVVFRLRGLGWRRSGRSKDPHLPLYEPNMEVPTW